MLLAHECYRCDFVVVVVVVVVAAAAASSVAAGAADAEHADGGWCRGGITATAELI